MKNVYAIIEAECDDKNTLIGEWAVFEVKSSTKHKWEANILMDEASCKILHASYDRIDHEEHATIVLYNFETNGEWKEFTGKSKLATVYSNVFYVLEFVTGKSTFMFVRMSAGVNTPNDPVNCFSKCCVCAKDIR